MSLSIPNDTKCRFKTLFLISSLSYGQLEANVEQLVSIVQSPFFPSLILTCPLKITSYEYICSWLNMKKKTENQRNKQRKKTDTLFKSADPKSYHTATKEQRCLKTHFCSKVPPWPPTSPGGVEEMKWIDLVTSLGDKGSHWSDSHSVGSSSVGDLSLWIPLAY